ncbi:MAG: DUF2169 domain-containing protein [Myxococcales bacterium]|nr:DUF2169 domain-containing protein [Myxococcales bacterium]
MTAGLALLADTDARDHCLVVVKGTFIADEGGGLHLADEQQPLVTADDHYGAPETSPVRHECDFVLTKPRTDVLVVGKAVAPGGDQVQRLTVRLELPGRTKEVTVVGDRRWVRMLGAMVPSEPRPFTEIPLTFDRAFGGSDDTQGPDKVAVEPRNLAGVGFHPHRPPAAIEGLPVPNLEHPLQLITSSRDHPPPVGFGVVGRAWLPRRNHAGTYDQVWLDRHAPFLPPDFDPQYHQCAPEDQQIPHLRGDEVLRCVHMAARPVVQYVVPRLRVPVRFRGVDGEILREARLDTVILEPDRMRAQLVWRCSVPVGKKPSDLREIRVGEHPDDRPEIVGNRDGKPIFRGLDAAVRTLRKRRAPGGT